ncbi:hypothetical protein [uncultured Helicobacter sp.]|uniref:hypothetical protein n=1 Tax=uncultured Helicobacter sp. TaxID=175537 RepID=UPI0025D9B775|nr:hypothetical protein [uncultured Helicobacter sp.]
MKYKMSFLKSIKFITITLCVALVLFMIITYTNTKAKLKAMEYENATLLHTLKKQNQAIEKLSLDIQTYKNQKPKIQERIITKYQPLQSPQGYCEERLQNIQNHIKLWYGER